MNYTDFMGVQHEQSEAPERRTFVKRVKRMFELLASKAPIDAAVDQMAVDYIHGCMCGNGDIISQHVARISTPPPPPITQTNTLFPFFFFFSRCLTSRRVYRGVIDAYNPMLCPESGAAGQPRSGQATDSSTPSIVRAAPAAPAAPADGSSSQVRQLRHDFGPSLTTNYRCIARATRHAPRAVRHALTSASQAH